MGRRFTLIFKDMFAVTLLILLVGIETSMAAVDDCGSNQFWNGKQCVFCSKCPRGFGVKENCSPKHDTECQPCWPGYDYSNTSSYQNCILCDKFSNCLPGNPKKIKNCTIFSPPVCDGCETGYYLEPHFKPNGRCLKCSPPCNIQQEETRPCSTEHDRTCAPKTTTSARPILSSPSTPPTVGTSTGSSKGGAEEPNTEETGKISREDKPWEKSPWFWVSFVAVVVIVVPVTVLVVKCRRRQKRIRRRTRTNTNPSDFPMHPLLGLDLPVKYLDIEKRKSVAKMLNGKDNNGYFYWHIVAEKLDFGAECRAWEAVDNPTEKLLSAYGELEGSTVRNLISAIRKAGLTHFANEVKKLVSTTQDQDDDNVIEVERA